MTQPSELTSLLQQLVTQQREDRIAQEEARRAHEAQIAAIQREAARERAAKEERFFGLIDRVSQRTDAQFQQMQQGMMQGRSSVRHRGCLGTQAKIEKAC